MNLTEFFAALAGIPYLPAAGCRGHEDLYDQCADGDEGAIEIALKICEACPVLADCTTWVASLPPRRRPAGVVAAQLYVGGRTQPWQRPEEVAAS